MTRRMALRYTFVAAMVTTICMSDLRAHDTSLNLSGLGTATIDGVFSPCEWDAAGMVTLDVDVPANDGSGTTPMSLFVMNDAVNLYVGFQVTRSAFGGATNPALFFDTDHDTIQESGDDHFGMSVGMFSPPTFFDVFVNSLGHSLLDTSDGGTVDGSTWATNDDTFTYIEMSHPFNSADDAHDFSLVGGETIGFGGFMNLFALDTSCNEGSPCQVTTDFGGTIKNPTGDITIVDPTPGACQRAAVEARRDFVAACVAAGGSPSSCNRTGTEVMLAQIAACP